MTNLTPSSNADKSILFVTDDLFIKGLIAQINSVIRHFPESKIYLVHELNNANLERVVDYIYKQELFDSSVWEHLEEKYGHVTKTNQGKLQVSMIEEPHIFYMDTDAVIHRRFEWEYPDTMTLDIKQHPIEPQIRYYKELSELRKFVLKCGGLTEKEGDFTLFTDGAFFVNKYWMNRVLQPKIMEMSVNYNEEGLPHRWYAMEYFHAAICVLGQPVSSWKLKQALPGIEYLREKYPQLFTYTNYQECDIVHYLSYQKPWNYEIGQYPPGGDIIWWDYYLNGPVPPLEHDKCKKDIFQKTYITGTDSSNAWQLQKNLKR